MWLSFSANPQNKSASYWQASPETEKAPQRAHFLRRTCFQTTLLRSLGSPTHVQKQRVLIVESDSRWVRQYEQAYKYLHWAHTRDTVCVSACFRPFAGFNLCMFFDLCQGILLSNIYIDDWLAKFSSLWYWGEAGLKCSENESRKKVLLTAFC